MINDQGGVSGRQINLISVDDGYLPANGNETRRLVEVERVALLRFDRVPPQLSVAKYLTGKIPQLFIDAALTLGQLQETPYTMAACARAIGVGARFYTRYILNRIQCKIASFIK